jgi:oligoendopeptidase F
MTKKISFSLLFIIFTVSALFAQDKSIPDYSTTTRKDIPVEYTWKIEDIYSSYEAWQKDKDDLVALASQVDTKKIGWTESPQKMLDMFMFFDDINIKGSKLFSYAANQSNVDLSNSQYNVMTGELQSIFVNFGSKFTFLRDDILKMNKDKLEEYYKKEPKLETYRFSIESILLLKDHILPQDQEKIMSLVGLMTATPSQAANFLRDVDLPAPEITLSDGTKVILNTANFLKYRGSKNASDRKLVMTSFFNNLSKFKNTFAALLDGVMKQQLFNAKARNYKDCLQAKLFGDNIDESIYLSLIKNVRENLEPLHRYLKLRKQLLGLDVLKYDDIYASAVQSIDNKYTYDEAANIVLEAVKPLGDDYVQNLRKGFESRWVDIYPNKDKQSGAYSGGVYGVHPFVKMNYNGKYETVATLAHELGHSMHSFYANSNQNYSNSQYPIFLAEIASTFNENLLTDYMIKNEKDDMFKLFLLDKYLEQARGTIYRQTLFAEFELEVHKRVEEGKTLTPDFLNKLYLDLTKQYYGDDKGIMQVDDYIQYEWSYIPHFYKNFYVFQYSTGMISSMALSQRVLENIPGAREKYLGMLKAGGSNYPMVLLKNAGVDLNEKETYTNAFKCFDNLVAQMEELVAKLKKEGKL